MMETMPERPPLTPRRLAIMNRVRVNAPAMMLKDGLLEKFLAWGIHPELGLDADVLDNLPRLELEDMARRFKAAGLRPTVHGPFFDLSPGALDPLVLDISRRRFSQALELAALFSPEHIVFHANYDKDRNEPYQEVWLEISLETWRPLAQRARELGFRIVLENVYEQTPEEIKPLLDGLAAEGVGLCLDIGHAAAFGRAGILDWLEALEPHLAALHLHDNHGDRDEHLPIGWGSIDFKAVFKRLAGLDARPKITLEPHEESHLLPSLAALESLWPWPVES